MSDLAAAQMIARSACIGADDAARAVETTVRDVAEGPAPRLEIRDIACSDTMCTVHFDLLPRSDCAPGEYAPPRAPRQTLRPEMSDFVCDVPRGACAPTGTVEPGGATSSEVVVSGEIAVQPTAHLADCVKRAVSLVTVTRPCSRMDPISDPVAPPPPPNARAGFDLGVGWQWGIGALHRPLLVTGASMDWSLTTWLSGGVRLGYIAAAGSAFDRDGDGQREADARNYHALDASGRVRARFGNTVRRLELEAALGHRLTLSGSVPSQVTIGGGATAYFSAFGLGLQYVRGLGDGGLDHTVLLTTQRNSPLDMDNRAFGSPRGDRAPRVGLGLHAILTGWGFAEHTGPMLPGAAIELPVLLTGPLAAVVRYDILWFPAIDAPAFIAQTVLGGLQYLQVGRLPVGLGALFGYAVVDGRIPRRVDGGSVIDGGVWYWLDDLGVHLGLNGRWGLGDANRDLRAVYVSLGARQIFF